MIGDKALDDAIEMLGQGRFQEAQRAVAWSLWQRESSAAWMQWATVEQKLGAPPEEVIAALQRALEVDPQNIGAIQQLTELGAVEPILTPYLDLLDGSRSGSPGDADESDYFATHRERYAATLDAMPNAGPSESLLELGSGYFHMTPSLIWHKGYTDTRCSDFWNGSEPSRQTLLRAPNGSGRRHIPVDNFDVHVTPWPYDNEAFNVVLCCEILEHLHSDPMQFLNEINRVLKPGGLLLLTTPNIASTKSVLYALKGLSPYIYGSFELEGRPTDRHNREYTVTELKLLLESAGMEIAGIRTPYIWWKQTKPFLRVLPLLGFPVAHRGDDIICTARKCGQVRCRYPDAFYTKRGVQHARLVKCTSGHTDVAERI